MLINLLTIFVIIYTLLSSEIRTCSALLNLHRRKLDFHSANLAQFFMEKIVQGLYDQRLDHFDEANNLTWKQVYKYILS